MQKFALGFVEGATEDIDANDFYRKVNEQHQAARSQNTSKHSHSLSPKYLQW